MRCGYCYGRLNTAMQCESCGKYNNFPVSATAPYETTVLPQNTTPPAPDLPALLKRCKPWLVERQIQERATVRSWVYPECKCRACKDHHAKLAELDALLSDIAKAEEDV